MSKLVSAVIMTAALLSPQGCVPPAGEPPAPEPAAVQHIVIKVESNPSNKIVVVRLSAIDHSGLPTVNLEYGELYPTEHTERTPYAHQLVAPASAVVSYGVSVIGAGEPEDLFGCSFEVNGVKQTGLGEVAVKQIQQGAKSTQVYCEYIWRGTG